MKWAYILYLPALISLVWPVAMMIFKRRLIPAQLLLGGLLILEAFAMAMFAAYFRHRSGMVFVYDFSFQLSAIFCAPLYYLGICSLTEPRGVTQRQRLVLLYPLIYIAGLTIGIVFLGRMGYEAFCQQKYAGEIMLQPGHPAYNFMLGWNCNFFPLLLVVASFIIMLVASRKLFIFRNRYNSFYADPHADIKPMHTRAFDVVTWIFLPMSAFIIISVLFHMGNTTFNLTISAVVLAVIQFVQGRYIYHLYTDAKQLAELVRKDMQFNPDFRPTTADVKPSTAHDICHYIEREGFLDLNLSVVDLAMRFRISQDAVVDRIHDLQGMKVLDYIDSVRVEHAIKILSDSEQQRYTLKQLDRVASQCGFIDGEALDHAFKNILQMTINQWINRGGVK